MTASKNVHASRADAVTDLLNREGYFFEAEAIKRLEAHGYTIRGTNYRIADEGIGQDFDVDIFAEKTFGETSVYYLIDCKRVRRGLKWWVFIHSTRRNPPPFLCVKPCQPNVIGRPQTHVTQCVYSRKPVARGIEVSLLETTDKPDPKYVYLQEKDAPLYRVSPELNRIEKACFGVVGATTAMCHYMGKMLDGRAVGPICFLPVVLSNASLWEPKDMPNVDFSSGTASAIDYEERNFVLVDYPTPGGGKFSIGGNPLSTIDSLGVAVINDKGFEDFFRSNPFDSSFPFTLTPPTVTTSKSS